jgi:transposase, IS30 family
MGAAHLTQGQRGWVHRLHAEGWSLREIAAEVGCSHQAVWLLLRYPPIRPARSMCWSAGPGRLSLADREEISVALRDGATFTSIAATLGYAVSTVSREVAGNGGRSQYRAWRAHDAAFRKARRPKTAKLVACPDLATQVSEWLLEWWSPVQIANRLRSEFPDDPMMWVSHETIYQSLFVQGRGELRRELTRCLRSGRAKRRPRTRAKATGQLCDMVMISERPAEADDRAVPGHWEGDLIIGKDNRSAVGTLVERATRYVMLLHLPNGRAASEVRAAMTQAITGLPEHLWRSITWDQGKEMAEHVQFGVDTGVQIYFCDPHSPWQRGSNENTNGLLRQWMAKGTDLSAFSAADLDLIAHKLNNRPRQTLGWMKPSEKLTDLLAHTT